MVVGGLLFLAFAYFAVGQAVANRSDAQGAADAAALAAAGAARSHIADELLGDDLDLEELEELIEGQLFPTADGCAEADIFANKNGADAQSCTRLALPQQGFEVDVKVRRSVGSSIIPGTEGKRSSASAEAVIEPKCTLKTEPADASDPIELTCDGEDLVIDPEEDDPLPRLGDLFTVRLTN